MIEIEHLTFAYDRATVLDDVSVSAADGRLLAILGPNGAGKTTLFRCILGEQKRYVGKILIDGTDAKTLSAREQAHRIAYIPQTHAMTFRFSVRDMVLMGTTHRISPLSAPKAAEVRLAEQAMERVGIAAIGDADFSHISGGEQQLVYIARALAQQAKTLLMDEPTSSLDYGNQLSVLETVRTLSREGYTVLLSTHNPQHALWFADDILALSNGRVAANGPTKDTLTPELLHLLYRRRVMMQQTDSGPVIVPAPEEIPREEDT